MIGVFDSGLGGLTVLRALSARLPRRRFLYLADHANAPYGDLPADRILTLTQDNLSRLFRAGCRLAIIGCNTVSAVALRPIQRDWLPRHWPGCNALGLIVPTIEAVTGVDWNDRAPPSDTPAGTVAIFATSRTVDSAVYPVEIAKRARALRVVEQPCPNLAAAIEDGAPEDALRHMVARYVADLYVRTGGADPQWVILGCTHYTLVAYLFREALPPGMPIVSQPQAVAQALEGYLGRHPEFDSPPSIAIPEPRCRFLTTGQTRTVTPLARRFIEDDYVFEGTI
jgi:glutamate racemase